jgi:hypothetical protein
MIKVICRIAILSLMASPCLAAKSEVYGALTMAQLGSILTNERGVPAELKNVDGRDILYVDGEVYKSTIRIQLGGILCDSGAPPSCGGISLAGLLPVPANAISDPQLQVIGSKFDFVTVDRLDATHIVASMASILQGGVTAENIDNYLGFFAGQLNQVRDEIQKLVPQEPAKGKGKGK